ncbi:retinol dehydrogenase 13-like [Helicoverpa zea]|uniref:retinol dehydrogenase 13-like n=1 Tax=Helicoverpa zea TaxID=7113 RepID=UPI001F55AC81|nr:retinol dehydrogenase 13-like [Helicoverpa zea]
MPCNTGVKLNGKVAVVTGGSSGMGYEAAKNLANHGARVIIASRNAAKLEEATKQIISETGNPNVSYKTVDLASLSSVRNLANEINMEDKVNVLINNAGAVALPDSLTADDLNLTMQVNYLGAFLLTFLLLPKLRASAPSRIVNGVAATMYVGHIDFDHWNDLGRYNVITALGTSKLAVALFSAELDNRLKNTGVTANSFDPFLVKDTNLLSNIPQGLQNVSQFFLNIVGQRKEDVGEQIAYLAAAPELEGVSGKLFKFCHAFPNHWLVHNRQFTKRLWEESKKAVKITQKEDWEMSNAV